MAKALDKLQRLTKRREPVAAKLATIDAERDKLIREAVFDDGETQQAVANVTGLSKGRVSQIAPKRRQGK